MIRPTAVAATMGMWIVLIMGATVTNTGSERGCGPSWPLCRGRFIPQFAVSTFIEFSHRAAVGVETMLILAFGLAAWILYRSRIDFRVMIPLMIGFLFLQAGLGAWAVMSPQNPAVLALHFGVSLIAFASVALTAATVFEIDGADRLRRAPPSRSFQVYAWSATTFSYVVVYLGAYVRHVNADDACHGWPLCNGRLVPVLHGLVTPAFFHRLAALVLILVVCGLVIWSARFRSARPDIFRAALTCAVLVVLQALSGAIVIATDMDLLSALLHAGLVALLFGALTYLCLHVVRLPSLRGVPARLAAMPQPAG